MLRGGWCSNVALVVLTLCVVSPSNVCAQPFEAQTRQAAGKIEVQPALTALPEQVKEGPEYYNPCDSKEENRNSDLCAQWKAADAARESADWTRRTFYVSIVGGIIAFLTLAAAVAAAVFAKLAADHTAEGAIQAKRSAEAAENTFLKLERPYVFPQDVGTIMIPFGGPASGNRWRMQFPIINYGKTPAVLTRVTAKFMMLAMPLTKEKMADSNIAPGQTEVDNENLSRGLGTGDKYEARISLPYQIKIDCYETYGRPDFSGPEQLFLFLSIRYEDMLGIERIAHQCWKYEHPSHGTFIRYGGKQWNYEEQLP